MSRVPAAFPPKRNRNIRWWHITGIIIAIILIAAGSFYGYIGSRLHNNPHIRHVQGARIADNNQIDQSIENILLIGVDQGSRSDTMMVVSLNRRDNNLKLISLLRDIKIYYPDKKSYANLNTSYQFGGPEETVNTINKNFKLDIKKYMVIDFRGFKEVIDTLGGVSVNLSSKEASFINVGNRDGVYHLDGDQALAYVRTRHIDNDFKRTERQRKVMISLSNKFKEVGFSAKVSAANQCLSFVQTNMPVYELTGNLSNIVSKMRGNIEQKEIPTDGDGMYTIETSPLWFFDLDWEREVGALHKFIYAK